MAVDTNSSGKKLTASLRLMLSLRLSIAIEVFIK